MATTALNTDTADWTSALHNYSVAHKAWTAVRDDDQCPARGKAARGLLEAQSKVFATPALTLGGVRKKLEIWWGEALYSETIPGHLNRIVMGDLTRLELEAAGATELEASGRTPEEAANQLTEWQSTLAEYAVLEKLLLEGPSPRWEGRDADEIINAMDFAAAGLLKLPAPNIYGLIRKLEMRWEDERFDEIGNAALYVQILRDLHRLARELEATKIDAE
jgi:hypothetical protein